MKKLLFIIIFLSFYSVTLAATVTRYVDPDATGAGNGTSWADAYTSLSAWNTGEATDLVSAGDIHIVNCRASSGTDDTTQAYIGTGWTTGSANYIEIVGDASSGIWDDAKYVLNVGDQAYGTLRIREEYVRVKNLQITGTASGANGNVRVYIGQVGVANDIRISNCLITGAGTTSAGHIGIEIDDANANVQVWNTIIYNLPSTATYSYGAYITCATAKFWNCIITTGGEYYGVRDVAGTTEIKNCAIFNNSDDDILNFDTIENCATDQGAGEGTNGLNISTTWNTTCFTNQGSGDYSIESDSPLVGQGQDDPGGAIQDDTDIAGTARSSTWDIGAFEYSGAGPAGLSLKDHIIIIN